MEISKLANFNTSWYLLYILTLSWAGPGLNFDISEILI